MADGGRFTGRGTARAILAGALLAAAAPGCDPSLYKKTRFDLYDYRTEGGVRIDARSIPLNFKSKETGPTLPVMRIYTRQEGSGQYGFLRANHSFRNPFCYSVSTGMHDPNLPLAQTPSFAATEISHRDSDPLVYYGIGVQFHSGGAQAFGYKNGSSNIGTIDFAGAQKVEVGFYTSGSSLFYMAREHGTGEFSTFASTTYDGNLGPFVASIGGANLSVKGSGYGFSTPIIYYNARDGDPSLEDSIAEDIDCAWDAYLDFCDGYADGDYAYADDALLDALDYLDGAYQDATGLSDEDTRNTVMRELASSIASLEKARAMLLEERPLRSVNKLVLKGMDRTARALPPLRGFQTRL